VMEYSEAYEGYRDDREIAAPAEAAARAS
jgi:hypothetical protein